MLSKSHVGFPPAVLPLAAFLFLLLLGPGALAETEPQPGMQYRLHNAFLKEAKVLGVQDGKLVMADYNPSSKDDRNLWRFIPVPGNPGYFRMINVALGEGQSLDSTPDMPGIRPSGSYTGQLWRLMPVHGDLVRLSNMYQPNKALDNFGSPPYQPRLAGQGNYTGQFWRLSPAGLDITISGSSLTLSDQVAEDSPPEQDGLIKHQDGDISISSSGSKLPNSKLFISERGRPSPWSVDSPNCDNLRVVNVPIDGAGLGWFAARGALPLITDIYSRPDRIVHYLNNYFKIGGALVTSISVPRRGSRFLDSVKISPLMSREEKVARAYAMMVEYPIRNPFIKGMLFERLVEILSKNPGAQRGPERELFEDFREFSVWFSKLVANCSREEYGDWVAPQLSKPRTNQLITAYNVTDSSDTYVSVNTLNALRAYVDHPVSKDGEEILKAVSAANAYNNHIPAFAHPELNKLNAVLLTALLSNDGLAKISGLPTSRIPAGRHAKVYFKDVEYQLWLATAYADTGFFSVDNEAEIREYNAMNAGKRWDGVDNVPDLRVSYDPQAYLKRKGAMDQLALFWVRATQGIGPYRFEGLDPRTGKPKQGVKVFYNDQSVLGTNGGGIKAGGNTEIVSTLEASYGGFLSTLTDSYKTAKQGCFNLSKIRQVQRGAPVTACR